MKMNWINNGHTLLMVLLIGLICLSTSGCLSYMTYKSSEKKVALRKAVLANDQPAIRAIRLGEGGAGIGIDVSNMEALSEQPWKQFFSAIGDVALLYGTYEGVKQIDEGLSDDNGSSGGGNGHNTAGRDSIVVNGDGNTINTSSSESEAVDSQPALEE